MKRLKLQAGSNLVEFALVLPLLLVLMFGIVDFGLALFDKAVITNAAREGARTGVVFRAPPLTEAHCGRSSSGRGEILQHVLGEFRTGKPTPPTLRGLEAGTEFSSGDTLTVRVNYSYNYLVVSKLVPSLGTLNLKGTSVMRFE